MPPPVRAGCYRWVVAFEGLKGDELLDAFESACVRFAESVRRGEPNAFGITWPTLQRALRPTGKRIDDFARVVKIPR